jgi:mannose-6-phosphate isomerase-like protein (cupin superfamily)
MRIVSRPDIHKPVVAALGEEIYEMIGRAVEIGGTVNHSLVHVVIRPGKSSPPHYHKVSEETYYILSGEAEMVINDHHFTLKPAQACLIQPGEVHRIWNRKGEDLNFLAVSAPAWAPDDMYPV